MATKAEFQAKLAAVTAERDALRGVKNVDRRSSAMADEIKRLRGEIDVLKLSIETAGDDKVKRMTAALTNELATVSAERDALIKASGREETDRKVLELSGDVAALREALRKAGRGRREARPRDEMEAKVRDANVERDKLRNKRRDTIAARLRADLDAARAVTPVAPVVEYVDNPAHVLEIKRLRALQRGK